jgi:hypothetical protein
MGLTLEAIRRCIVAWRVDSQLPPHLRGQLAASHLARLGSVASPVDRVQLADDRPASKAGRSKTPRKPLRTTAPATARRARADPSRCQSPCASCAGLGASWRRWMRARWQGLTADQLAEVRSLVRAGGRGGEAAGVGRHWRVARPRSKADAP